MQIARHWISESAEAADARGVKHVGTAWGWSASSVDEAQRRARSSAERVARWLASGGVENAPPASAEYLYGLDRPPREEIVQELHDAAGEASALITRNAYGALVLNCRDLMFVDVDFKPSFPNPMRMLGSLFGKKAAPAAGSEEGVLHRVREWCAGHRDYGVRVYRTAAGFRLCVADRVMRADSDATRTMLVELGSDPLYRRLCDVQQCFRARLSPKPWRMEMTAPPVRFPFADAAEEEQYRAWQREYDEAAPRFATCRLVEWLGPDDVHAELAPLVNLHDSLTGVGRDAELA